MEAGFIGHRSGATSASCAENLDQMVAFARVPTCRTHTEWALHEACCLKTTLLHTKPNERALLLGMNSSPLSHTQQVRHPERRRLGFVNGIPKKSFLIFFFFFPLHCYYSRWRHFWLSSAPPGHALSWHKFWGWNRRVSCCDNGYPECSCCQSFRVAWGTKLNHDCCNRKKTQNRLTVTAPGFLKAFCYGLDVWRKCVGEGRGGHLVLRTLSTGDKESTLPSWWLYLLLGGAQMVRKATIQNRKTVFVLIAVMTHSRVLRLCGKQAQLVKL